MDLIISLSVLIFSIIIHEIAHGYAAYLLGDDTAKRAGRLTLNPLSHLDPFGSIFLPLILVLTNSPVLFGWAKPVPINYGNLKNPRTDIRWVSMAGILANLCLVIIFTLVYHLSGIVLIKTISISFVLYNLSLALFNSIPIPPLDGSRLLTSLLPYRAARWMHSVEPYGILILFILLYFKLFNFLGGWIYQLLSILLG